MSDLIDRDVLLETMKHRKEYYGRKSDPICLVEDAPSIPAPRWVRCEDRLPDLLQFVVVCNDEGKCVVAQYVGYQTDSMTPWRIAYSMYDTDAYNEADEGPVCYWMPIEPPKEDE